MGSGKKIEKLHIYGTQSYIYIIFNFILLKFQFWTMFYNIHNIFINGLEEASIYIKAKPLE